MQWSIIQRIQCFKCRHGLHTSELFLVLRKEAWMLNLLLSLIWRGNSVICISLTGRHRLIYSCIKRRVCLNAYAKHLTKIRSKFQTIAYQTSFYLSFVIFPQEMAILFSVRMQIGVNFFILGQIHYFKPIYRKGRSTRTCSKKYCSRFFSDIWGL